MYFSFTPFFCFCFVFRHSISTSWTSQLSPFPATLSLFLFAHPRHYTFSSSGKVWRYFLSPLSISSHSFLSSLLSLCGKHYSISLSRAPLHTHPCVLPQHPTWCTHYTATNWNENVISAEKGDTKHRYTLNTTLHILDFGSDMG